MQVVNRQAILESNVSESMAVTPVMDVHRGKSSEDPAF